MLVQKPNTIIVVHNEDVWWINETTGQDEQWFRQPLDQFLANEAHGRQMPAWVPVHAKPLCIFPDHWFGSETYPFQSRKPSLIEPFLERKLTAAYPGQKEIRNFFNYRHSSEDAGNKLCAIFLQEDKGYALYDTLQRLHHQPRRITSPAFVWEERLKHADSDFDDLGTLLIHHTGNECQLYFYYQGSYLFSRSVILGDAADGVDALVFEINQSLYMFSQKAKSELDRIYVVCNDPHCQVKLSETLGREVVDLSSLAGQQAEKGDIPGLEPLNDLLQWSRTHRNADFFSIIQRQLKRTMEWWPVQLTGIVFGLILLFCLMGENLYLRALLHDENREQRSIETSLADHGHGIMLSEQAGSLNHVLDMAARNKLIDAVYRLPAGFPAQFQLKELDLDMTSPPNLKLTAMVQARDTRELTALLSRVVAQVKGTFENVAAFSLNDIDVRLDLAGQGQSANRYCIAFQLELI